ncbi:MAG: hypothetical protein B7C24_15060 [Bacteroidetes bacterium 4572_77]|nr:MAG: hypothetical protein B7C24_15060 [Bacteroidetes bacterium 4572_77]
MSLKDELKAIAERIENGRSNVSTEEATKHAFVLPFLQAIGYDIFNPLEVEPEAVADVSTYNGSKVDYCIKKDGQPIMILECKHWNKNIDSYTKQLSSYFVNSNINIAIITNGIEYRFYSDTIRPNIMDDEPFFAFFITEIEEQTVKYLSFFTKDSFHSDTINQNIQDLIYTSKIEKVVKKELEDPSDEFINFFAKQIESSNYQRNRRNEFFKEIITQAINKQVNNSSVPVNTEPIKIVEIDAEIVHSYSKEMKNIFDIESLTGIRLFSGIFHDTIFENVNFTEIYKTVVAYCFEKHQSEMLNSSAIVNSLKLGTEEPINSPVSLSNGYFYTSNKSNDAKLIAVKKLLTFCNDEASLLIQFAE